MGGCGECMAKFGLIVFNFIFMCSGIAVLGVGIWVKVDKNVVNMQTLIQFDNSDKALDTAAWVLIGFGSFVLIISALGFLAACCNKITKVFIGLYIFFLVVVFIGEFGGGISAAVFKGKIDDELPKLLSHTFDKYQPGTNLLAKAWDYMQVWLKCCGSTGIPDYGNVNFTDTSQNVPVTCCVLTNGDPEHPAALNNTACQIVAGTSPLPKTSNYVHIEGCFASLEANIKSHIALIIGVAVGIAMIQILGIVLACCVCKTKDFDDDDEKSYVR